MNFETTGIILMAGNSIRYGKNINKNFELINNKPVFMYSLNAFIKNNYIKNIIIVAKTNEKKIVKKIINNLKNTKQIKIVNGGNTRKESVYNALLKVKTNIVIIQDSARPLIQQKYINKCIKSMKKFDGASIGVRSKDTIKIANKQNIVDYTTNRENTWIIQTPQCFHTDIILNMHKKYKDIEVTDDCSLLEKDKYKIKLIEGDYFNIKITTIEDLTFIENFVNK